MKMKPTHVIVWTLFAGILLLGRPWQAGATAGATDDILQTSGAPVFTDVPESHWAWNWIETLYRNGVTTGCSTNPPMYCPEDSVTRAQMAIFLERGVHGSEYQPPAVGNGTGFNDVSTGYWAAAWIKQLAADGITLGCGAGNYCPEDPVTRAQMAVFLLRAEFGATYTPPAVGASTSFNDVSIEYWAAAWIKQLAGECITTGCGNGNYCPEDPVTRAQMAVFLVRTFDLPMAEEWYHYRITYSIILDRFLGLTKVWMPMPVNGVTQQRIKLLSTSPTPTDMFIEPKGNQIIFWQENIQGPGFTFSEQFEIYILKKVWDIIPEEAESYDPNDPLLAQYLKPSTMVQSDHPEMIAAAKEIVGDETNPYRKILLIVDWLQNNITFGGQYQDALSVLRTKKGLDCASWAHIFVALSKAAGVPARIVTGIGNLQPGTYNWQENNFGTHLWEEYYLPTYGWIPIDVLGSLFAESQGNRLIFSRDSDIDLGYGRGIVPWFHMPHVNTSQEEESDLILEVEILGIAEHPGE